MLKILLSDPESKHYDIKKMFSDYGISDFSILSIMERQKAREHIKKERPDFMIIGYDFHGADSGDAEKFIKENKGIPSVLLLYPFERGYFREVKILGIEPLYRDEIDSLASIIKRVTNKHDSINA